MEPRIQYAQTADGVSIAFWTLGEGMPLVLMPNLPFSHIELEWQIPEYRRWYELLMTSGKLVRYDNRGSGLSDRDVADHSLDAHVSDLEAVVEESGLQRFALIAPLYMGPVAIAYAVRQPERVSGLVLWCSFASVPDYAASPQVQTLAAMRDKDWIMYTETAAHAGLGWAEGEPARRYAALMRECATQDAVRAMFGAIRSVDVSVLLPQVKAPTLVLHRRQVSFPDVEMSRNLASKIPGARLVLLEGTSLAPFLGDAEATASAVHEFLGEGEEAGAEAGAPEGGSVRTVLFTDVEGSTALTQRLGDERGREVLREHERITREVLKAHGGSEVKTLGDGFMASFSSVTRAVECSIALQRAFAASNEAVSARPEALEGGAVQEPLAHASTGSARAGGEARAAAGVEPIRIRIGLNAGEPIEEEGDLFGAAVILAARIAAQAQGGEILASLAVRELCAGKGFLFADTGEVALKGFEEPVRLFAVRWTP